MDEVTLDCPYNDKRKARKKYRCCECGQEIQIGEYYFSSGGVDQGEWFRYKVCVICEKIREELAPNAPYEGLNDELDYLYGVRLV